MRKPFLESMQLMDEVSKNNRAWYTRDVEVGNLGYIFELSAEQRKREEEMDQDMAHMRTQIDLLTKHIVSKSEKVNAVGQPNKYEDQDINLDEEANYLGNQGGFQNYISGNQGQNYSREGQYDRPANREQETGRTKMGTEMIEVVSMCPQLIETGQVVVPAGVKEMKSDFSSMSQLRKNGSLPSDTIQNPKKDGHCMDSATRCGKILNDPIPAGSKHEQVLEQARREEDEAEHVDDLEYAQTMAQHARGKKKEVKGNMSLQQIPRPPPPFP
ncbi:hypothetical protein KY290_001067 [Solanum tuberosum]|uniref:Integrase core domain containing protein n=1 Tax=Solanum tuberosum TaxID=4113 RepID=A0ABQ7WN44_SOLTU|nr:hypothetical protein KY290_001067 [Solanum tuberosum]